MGETDGDGLNAMGRWYRLVRSCDCGSSKPFTHWHKDENGEPLFRVCEACEKKKISNYEAGKSGPPQAES